MKWTHDGPCAIARDDGEYMLNRAPQEGFPATYMLVKLGRRSGDLWEGSQVLRVVVAPSDAERATVVKSLMHGSGNA